MIESNLAKTLVSAYEKGYRIINGEPYDPSGKLLKVIKKNSYNWFSIRTGMRNNKFRNYVAIHRLIAYQKYGDKIFGEGIQVRHLDGNPSNNLDENIIIGTQSGHRYASPGGRRGTGPTHPTRLGSGRPCARESCRPADLFCHRYHIKSDN